MVQRYRFKYADQRQAHDPADLGARSATDVPEMPRTSSAERCTWVISGASVVEIMFVLAPESSRNRRAPLGLDYLSSMSSPAARASAATAFMRGSAKSRRSRAGKR